VQFARQAGALLDASGLPVEYHESDAAHHIDPGHVPAAVQWLDRTISGNATAPAAQEGR
jgi:phospholipase/carboxylesterase